MLHRASEKVKDIGKGMGGQGRCRGLPLPPARRQRATSAEMKLEDSNELEHPVHSLLPTYLNSQQRALSFPPPRCLVSNWLQQLAKMLLIATVQCMHRGDAHMRASPPSSAAATATAAAAAATLHRRRSPRPFSTAAGAAAAAASGRSGRAAAAQDTEYTSTSSSSSSSTATSSSDSLGAELNAVCSAALQAMLSGKEERGLLVSQQVQGLSVQAQAARDDQVGTWPGPGGLWLPATCCCSFPTSRVPSPSHPLPPAPHGAGRPAAARGGGAAAAPCGTAGCRGAAGALCSRPEPPA